MSRYTGTQTEKNLEAAFAGESQAPEICPTCAHPQSYFEISAENY